MQHCCVCRAPRIGASFEDDMAQTQQALEQSKVSKAGGAAV